jgi:hypothetical protein
MTSPPLVAAAQAATLAAISRDRSDGWQLQLRLALAPGDAGRSTMSRAVATLPHTGLGPGEHLLAWNGRTSTGRDVPRGIYWIRVDAGGGVATRRIVRLRP